MKITAASLLAIAMVATTAMGGTVMFEPADVNVQYGDAATVPMNITVAVETLDTFDALMTVFNAAPELVIEGFTFNTEFEAMAAFPPFVEPVDDGLSAGAFLSEGIASYMIGTLDVTVPAMTPRGDYMVYVDSSVDGLSELTAGVDAEDLLGHAMIHVIPEPATLALLGLGAVGLLARRRR